MKKKAVLKKKSTPVRRSAPVRRAPKQEEGHYVILIRSWVFMVLFAIMLGVGVIVGSYINNQLNGGTPTVAGYSTE